MLRELWALLRETLKQWQDDRGQQIGAALAFYSVFSLPPILLIAVTISGAVLGPAAARGRLAEQLQTFVGPHLAVVLEDFTRRTHQSSVGTLATALGVILLFISGTGAAIGLKDALNTVWGVVENPNRSWWGLVGDRLLALLLVYGFGALLLASTFLTTLLVGMGDRLARDLPFSVPVAQWVNVTVSGVMVTLLLAATFKWLPDVRVRWREVWLGAVVTAVLFMAGKELIGMYLARVAVSSTYGTAGSLVLVMLWIYYSAQILLLGAEFTQVYAHRRGAPIAPARGAISVATRRERDECLKKLREERALGQRDAERHASLPEAIASGGWNTLIWALGGLALGWLIGAWNK